MNLPILLLNNDNIRQILLITMYKISNITNNYCDNYEYKIHINTIFVFISLTGCS